MASLPRCRTIERRPSADERTADAPDADAPDAGTITLDETDRHRRRLAMTSDDGLAFVLELDAATLLRDGDRLVLEDGRRIVVRAAPEPLYEVRADDAHHLLRLAWHMGNRHLPTQLMGDHLRIRRDPVIGRMLAGLGADVREVEAGFDPEGGAYGDAGHHAAHEHGPEHVHAHGHAHVHAHGHAHEHAHESDHHEHREHGHGHDRAQGERHAREDGHDHDERHAPAEGVGRLDRRGPRVGEVPSG